MDSSGSSDEGFRYNNSGFNNNVAISYLSHSLRPSIMHLSLSLLTLTTE